MLTIVLEKRENIVLVEQPGYIDNVENSYWKQKQVVKNGNGEEKSQIDVQNLMNSAIIDGNLSVHTISDDICSHIEMLFYVTFFT